MNKVEPISSSENSLKIRIENDVISNSGSSGSGSNIPMSRSFESHLNNVNETRNYPNIHRNSISNGSLNVPPPQHFVPVTRRQISSSPVKHYNPGSSSRRRLSQDSGIVSTRGYISFYNVCLHFFF